MNEARMQIAARWLDKLGEISEGEQKALDSWLAADPENQKAYDQLRSNYENDTLTRPSSRETRRANGVHMDAKHQLRGLLYPWAAIIFSAILFVCFVFFLSPKRQESSVKKDPGLQTESMNYFSTSVGERLNFSISDGSVLHLNASTRITLVESESSRTVLFNHGEAFFEVAKNKSIPFVVETLYGDIKVLGTVFNVEHKANAVLVKVQEGEVHVVTDATVSLGAGEEVLINSQGVAEVIPSPPNSAPGGWRTGWVSMQAQPLSDFLYALQRYIDKPIVMDATLQKTPLISGRYHLDDPLKTLDLVASLNQLEVHESDEAYLLRVIQP